VAAQARGSGLAQSLFEQGLDHARAQGAKGMILWTDTRFARGHAFYEKLGFRREPVIRYLADASASWEYCFRRSLA
jgi:putative acetyltransferase